MSAPTIEPPSSAATWPPDSIPGIDFSNYDMLGIGDAEFERQARQLFAWGYRVALVGCQDPAIARRQIPILLKIGWEVRAVYAWVYFGAPAHTQMAVEIAIEVAAEFGILWCALDCEAFAVQDTQEENVRELHAAIAQLAGAGISPIKYTGDYIWVELLGNTADFDDVATWYANYPDDRAIHTTWKRGPVAIHQFASTPALADAPQHGRDQNCIIDPPWEDDMALTEAQVQAMIDAEFEKRLDDGAVTGSGIIGVSTFLQLVQEAIGMIPSTFADANGNPDPRPAQIKAYIAALGSGHGVSVEQVYADIGRIIGQAGTAIGQAGPARASRAAGGGK